MCDVQTTFSVPWSLDPRLTFSVGSVGLGQLFGPLELDLESLGADLEAVHGLDGGHGAHGVIVGDEAWNGRKKVHPKFLFARAEQTSLFEGKFRESLDVFDWDGREKSFSSPFFFPFWL